MSYARFSYADVYVYLDINGYLNCCGCILRDNDKNVQTAFKTTKDIISHLELHIAAGHHVPDSTIHDLNTDALENDAWIASIHLG